MVNYVYKFMSKLNKPVKHGTMKCSIKYQCRCSKCQNIKTMLAQHIANFTKTHLGKPND